MQWELNQRIPDKHTPLMLIIQDKQYLTSADQHITPLRIFNFICLHDILNPYYEVDLCLVPIQPEAFSLSY